MSEQITQNPLLRPYDKMVKIEILGRACEVPNNNSLLRCFQQLAPINISHGRFCWNQDCQQCRLSYDLGEGTTRKTALACTMQAKEGMRVIELSRELRYGLREVLS